MAAHFGIRRALCLIFFAALFSVPAFCPIIYGGRNAREVALTFDDGPSFKFTMKILDILRHERVKATFFIVGQKAEMYPEILKMTANAGHELANHTFYHSRITTLTNKKMLEEISDTTNAIRKITGENVRFFRPPFGSFDREKRKLVEKAGYGFVLWSVNADDFYHLGWGMRTAASIEKKVLRGVRGGDIILAHDDSIQLEKALPVIIETLKARGYRFVTMSELTGEKTR